MTVDCPGAGDEACCVRMFGDRSRMLVRGQKRAREEGRRSGSGSKAGQPHLAQVPTASWVPICSVTSERSSGSLLARRRTVPDGTRVPRKQWLPRASAVLALQITTMSRCSISHLAPDHRVLVFDFQSRSAPRAGSPESGASESVGCKEKVARESSMMPTTITPLKWRKARSVGGG